MQKVALTHDTELSSLLGVPPMAALVFTDHVEGAAPAGLLAAASEHSYNGHQGHQGSRQPHGPVKAASAGTGPGGDAGIHR